jgi:hypothetical protein
VWHHGSCVLLYGEGPFAKALCHFVRIHPHRTPKSLMHTYLHHIRARGSHDATWLDTGSLGMLSTMLPLVQHELPGL